jgi:hypothetical protein
LERLKDCRQKAARFLLFDETFPKLGQRAHSRDLVHLMRQIIRMFDEAVKEVTLDVPTGLPYKTRRKQHQLKRRLLRKHLRPLLATALKACSPGYESVCVLMLEGVISRLQDPNLVLQTASVQRLTKRLQRFVKKHGATITPCSIWLSPKIRPKPPMRLKAPMAASSLSASSLNLSD